MVGEAVVVGAAVVAVVAGGLDDLLLLPHAANANAATATVASARTWKERMKPPGQTFSACGPLQYGWGLRRVR